MPTLIAHGTQDNDVFFEQAEQAKRLIPNARLHTVDGGMHLLYLHKTADVMIDAQIAFIKEHEG